MGQMSRGEDYVRGSFRAHCPVKLNARQWCVRTGGSDDRRQKQVDEIVIDLQRVVASTTWLVPAAKAILIKLIPFILNLSVFFYRLGDIVAHPRCLLLLRLVFVGSVVSDFGGGGDRLSLNHHHFRYR